MSMTELNSTARDLMSVRAMIEGLQEEAEALTDKLKAAMVEHPLCAERMSGLDKDRLYVLLEREKDADTAAALRWAIFTLEQYLQ